MKIYMDVCCLSRPFDDQSQDKIRFETEAIICILKRCDASGDWKLIGSDIISLEISNNKDPVKKQKVSLLHYGVAEKIKYNAVIKQRAVEFRSFNVKLMDSLHLAVAEYASVDVFLTTDERLVKAAARTDIKVRVENPLKFYMEVLKNE